MGDKTILHSDMNCFYASVEMLHHPEFDGKPLAVGGDPEARHGIVLTANYIAKKCGVKTGMPSGFAHIDPDLPLFKEFQKYSNLRTMPIFDREWLPSGMWATMRTTGAGITSGMSVEEAVKAMEDSYNNLREQKR